ncbi:uncharacterized protein N7443_004368 [Penicillium atrosanguineum]|uniref:uncharacterized protein n=1 Tax=Penicillium atrosanguineum TaxID=1132637 RepID=UPI002397E9C1|nr:uncharacterized protein N7443_004368 [Penicillium atrosanguineum]KAJ5304708.1 hypothetical protein N7443_004368 [Penicillium atrosanguineum]
MAPGGVAATAKKYLRTVLIDAVTLPSHIGGFEVMDKGVCRNIEYADITMYSKEMGLQENISTEHPDYKNFQIDRPFLGNLYDIVICGGAVGDVDSFATGVCNESSYVGGSLVLLLHHVQSWDTVCILNAFNQFSDIELCKHREIRAIGSSFYLVAKNVNLEHPSARASISYWKDLWAYLTFKEFQEIPSPLSTVYMTDDNFAESVKNGFGPHFLRLAKPIWKIQADALRKATFTKHSQQ